MKLTGETEVLGEKPVPVPLGPPQIPHGLTPGSNLGLRGERPVTNRLSHGTAAVVQLFEALRYRPEGRGLFIGLILPAALWGRLSL
jgi:hypothetical protein